MHLSSLSHNILHVRELPEFLSLMSLGWPRCVLWHGWLPGLGLSGERDPWGASFGQLAGRVFERVLVLILRIALAFGARPSSATLMI